MGAILTALCLIAFILLLVYLFLRIFCFVPTLKQIITLRHLPGPKVFPIMGVFLEMMFLKNDELLPYMKAMVIDGYDRVAVAWAAGLAAVFLNGPDEVEALLSSTKHITKGEEYIILKPWLNEGLLVSTGQKWHRRRKLLTPTFHFKILEDESSTIYANARKFVDRLLETNNEPFNPYKKISSCTLDVMGDTAMGISLNSQDGQNSEYVATVGRVTQDVIYRILNTYLIKPWIWGLTSLGMKNLKDISNLQSFTNKIISERRDFLNNGIEDKNKNEDEFGRKKKLAFLDSLLEMDRLQPGEWTNEDIREEVDTFLFEGHDTTATLLLFALFELGHNPEVQEMAYNEQFEIFGDDDREPSMSDLSNMNYLERFIKESLRLYPSVPYLSRKLDQELKLKGFPPVPPNTNVVVSPYFLHRSPLLYPDPDRFDPDRFLPDECAKRHPFAYIPFSAGPRNCIGQKFAMMELKQVLSTVLRFCKVESVTKKSDLKLTVFVILRPIEPILIKVSRRKKE